ncbi:MAG TPA: glycosyltransferase family 1 protein [Zeimonas sp.]
MSVLARGLRTGGVDGIGVYTRELASALSSREDVMLAPVSFGWSLDGASSALPGSPLMSSGAHDLGRFAPRAACSSLFPLAFPGSGRLKGRVDVFHATDHFIPRLRGIPVVATLMDAIPLARPEWVRIRARGAKNWIWRRTARWADRIVTISAHSRREIVEHFGVPESRVDVVPLGVDARRFAPVASGERERVLARLGVRPPFFLFVGTIQPRKNVERIVAAHERLPAALRSEAPLIVAGRDGWGCDELVERLRAAAPDAPVRWLRYVSDRQAQVLMQSATALVFPSLHEGFGLPVVEAFASRLPVIASSTTALPEVAGDAALLVDPTNVDEIAGAMQRVLHDDALREDLRARGALRVREYTWERCAAATARIYRIAAGRD